MLHHLVLIASSRPRYRYRSGGSGYGDYLMFSWLWQKIRWWSLLVYFGICAVISGVKALFGIGDD